MQLVQLLANQSGSGTAVAQVAVTYGCELGFLRFGSRQPRKSPAVRRFSNPTLFSIGWSDPNLGYLPAVPQTEQPLGVNARNVTIGNGDGSKRVYDLHLGLVKNKFWSNPNQNGCDRHQNCYRQIDSEVFIGGWVKQSLGQKKSVEHQRTHAPYQVSPWSKYLPFGHDSILSGDCQSESEISND